METSLKESLHDAIEQLSEEECQKTLEFIQHIQQGVPSNLRHLSSDPTFSIPAKGFGTFQVLEPIQSDGAAASKLLVEDRR